MSRIDPFPTGESSLRSKLKWLLSVTLVAGVIAPFAVDAATPEAKKPSLSAWNRANHLSGVNAGPKADPDHDGATNLREFRLGLNPRKRDTDRDGLIDGREIFKYHTSAKRKDTDGDGLSDGNEVIKWKTNPRKSDTDGDGYSDGVEVRAKSNPRSKRSVPPPGVAATLSAPAAGGTAPGSGSGTSGSGAVSGSSGAASPTPPPPSLGGTLPGPPATPVRCDRTATTGNVNQQLSAAGAGQTVCLSAGSYPTINGVAKSGLVYVRPVPGAAATIALDFEPASNLVFDGFTISSVRITGATKNITIRNSTFTSYVVIDGVANSNILLDHNVHNNIDSPAGSMPARITLPYSCGTKSGVTVQNSLLSGGDSDGIQSGCGLDVLNNEFRDIHEHTGTTNHTDNIQLTGAPGSVVRGNWVHLTADYTSQGITAYDGITRATITDNVVDIRRAWGIELYSDNGSTVSHNVIKYVGGDCYYGNPCGSIDINRKTADPAGTGTIVTDNVVLSITANNGSTIAKRDHNLLRVRGGTGDLVGTPTFVGGANPTSWDGFHLTAGSAGHNAASDGKDVGIR